MSGLAIAILAAGGARRFGGGKLDADCAGKQVGRWVLETSHLLENARVAVVVTDPAPDFPHDAEIVWNLSARDGIGTSIATAARWAEECKAEALLIALADMPLVTAATLRALVEGPLPAAAAYPGGDPGVPACFPASMLPELDRLSGEQGAAALLRGRASVRLVNVPPDELRDVDRPEDLAEVVKILSSARV